MNHNLMLIGYEKGVIVLWDFESGLPTKNFPANVQDCQMVCHVSLCAQLMRYVKFMQWLLISMYISCGRCCFGLRLHGQPYALL